MLLRRFAIVLMVGLPACDTVSGPTEADRFKGSYTIFQVDTATVPFVVTQDSTCSEINLGGSAALDGHGIFQVLVDQQVTMCNGLPQGGFSEGLMTGHYTAADSQLTFTTDDLGASFTGVFDPGSTVPGQGGRAPSITLQIGTHTYRAANYSPGYP